MTKYPLLSEITQDQKNHMAWRADRYSGCGISQISKLCRGEYGDMAINEAFEKFGMTTHQSKWHAAAVVKYNKVTYKPIKA